MTKLSESELYSIAEAIGSSGLTYDYQLHEILTEDKPMYANKFKIDHIIESLINGQFKQAKAQTMHLCKTRPEKLAYKVGQVVGSLTDPDGFHHNPDLAVTYLNLFNRD